MNGRRSASKDRPCQHCKRKGLILIARDLCTVCYNDRGIRERYPPKGTTRTYKGEFREPTEEELNQIIAEQMQCLPSWWHRESQKTR